MTKPLQTADRQRVQTLAEFRYALRKFLQFSEKRAEDAGLHPQQHQLLLHIAGAPEGFETTVSYVAERLGLRHNSVVELSKRCEDVGLIHRRQDASDGRRVLLQITAEGHKILRVLSDDHERELHDLLPTLVQTLTQIKSSHQRTAKAVGSRALTKRNQK
ncbi:MarR family winged helix-turn-helix transcriptional regulator [Tunturiibacter lichenicola]|uniref:MarR family winged helix-turn-helix transcriptional regulator n=1 Tax=Tunturiibacter lichenicola TaxID=2051959 RepID=UPI003D9AB7FD